MLKALVVSITAPGRRWCTVAGGVGLALVVYLPAQASLPALCGALSRIPLQEWQAVLGPVSPLGLMASWAVMLVAMMAPLFAEPMRHVWFSSLPTRRGRAVLLCAAGYLVVWMAVAPFIMFASWTLHAGLSERWALPLATAAAITWSASPLSQRARNRCHRFLRVGARGLRADVECLIQGLYSGAMCVLACWPWMILPMLLTGTGHMIAMVGVSLWLALERILPAREANWQWPPAISQWLWRRRLRSRSGRQKVRGRLY